LEALQQWKQVLLSRRDELTAALVIDTGRWAESVLEVDLVGATIDRWCRTAPELLQDCAEKPTALPFVQLRQGATPYSLVGVISPWNFPLLLSMIDTVPALVAGSSVMVKPSEIAPRFIKPLRETIANVPELDGVLAFVEGAGETGAELIDLVDLVCFTGSVTTGRMVAEAAARQFIPAFLELGGKDPAIVLASADLEQAASAILWGSVANAGQSCLSIERIYVAEPIHDAFVDKLVEKAQRLRLAHPRPESGEIGPIIADRQADVITAHLRDAVEKGAIIHCGGSVENLGGGLWCRPTVISQVNHSMKIMTEETFGPIMPVMSFETVEEALALANDSLYGLSGAVFAGSVEEAMSVAERLEVGAVSINGAALTAVVHEGEKNAFKFSGLGGSRMGPAALRRFMRRRAFLIKKTSENDPWWFQETTDHASRIT
jgi:acyl-CoA reductase-like NAD-dependent aldehyde dehydrogenase